MIIMRYRDRFSFESEDDHFDDDVDNFHYFTRSPIANNEFLSLEGVSISTTSSFSTSFSIASRELIHEQKSSTTVFDDHQSSTTVFDDRQSSITVCDEHQSPTTVFGDRQSSTTVFDDRQSSTTVFVEFVVTEIVEARRLVDARHQYHPEGNQLKIPQRVEDLVVRDVSYLRFFFIRRSSLFDKLFIKNYY